MAGENALGGNARFAGSLGIQVVTVFDLVAARTGLREHEAAAAGHAPVSTTTTPDHHRGLPSLARNPARSVSPATPPPAGCSGRS